MPPSKPTNRSPSEGGDPAYLAFVRQLPCCAPGVRPCESPTPQHAHHSTGAGMGLKSSDRETMPLCWFHHAEFHQGNGAFELWSRDDRRVFQSEQVERVQRAYALACSVRDGTPEPTDSDPIANQ